MKRLTPVRNKNKNQASSTSYLAIDDDDATSSDDEEKIIKHSNALEEQDNIYDENNPNMAQLNITDLDQRGQTIATAQLTPKISNNQKSPNNRSQSNFASSSTRLPIGSDMNSDRNTNNAEHDNGVIVVQSSGLSNPSNSVRITISRNNSSASIDAQSAVDSLYTDGSFPKGAGHLISNSTNPDSFDEIETTPAHNALDKSNFSSGYLAVKSSDSTCTDEADDALVLAIDRLHQEHLQQQDVDAHSLQSTEYDSVRVRYSDQGTDDDDDEYVDNANDTDLDSRDLDSPSDLERNYIQKSKAVKASSEAGGDKSLIDDGDRKVDDSSIDGLGFSPLDTLNTMKFSIVSSSDCSTVSALSEMEQNVPNDGMIRSNGAKAKYAISVTSSSDEEQSNGRNTIKTHGESKAIQDRFDTIAAMAASQSAAAATILVSSGFSPEAGWRNVAASSNSEHKDHGANKASGDDKIISVETTKTQQFPIMENGSACSSEVNIYPAQQRLCVNRKVTVIVAIVLLISIVTVLLVIFLS